MTYKNGVSKWTISHGLIMASLSSGTITSLLTGTWLVLLNLVLTMIGKSSLTGVICFRLVKILTPEGFVVDGDKEITIGSDGLLSGVEWFGPKGDRANITAYVKNDLGI